MWESMFALGLPLLEKMLRPLVVYGFLLIGLRVAGKRELAQLNAMDLIVLLTLSNTVQNAIIGPDDTITGGLVGAATLLTINHVVVRFLYNHDKVDRLVEGEPTKLIEHGKVLENSLRKELITHAELEIAAHKQGFASLAQVDTAVLESGGVISFLSKQPPVGELRHGELTKRLDQIHNELGELRELLIAKQG